MSEPSNLKIISLVAENIKKLRAVEITPDGNIVTISGRNGQGKTSILDSIWLALSMSDARIGTPIRKGEKKARIKLDMGELVVERKFTEGGGSTLTVANAQGATFKSPQTMLNSLIGALSFDPLSFTRKDASKQFEELRSIVKLDIDIDALTLSNKLDYDKRTAVNRDAKTKRTQFEAMKIVAGLPTEAIDESALLTQIQEAAESNTMIETRKGRREQARLDIIAKKNRALDLRSQAEELRARATSLDNDAAIEDGAAADIQKQLDEAPVLPEPVDISSLRIQLDRAKETNAAIENSAKRKALEEETKALEKQSEDLTAAMERRDKQKFDAIQAAQMPVEGLSFGDGVVTFNGVPFSQASSAEQLSVSMAIAMAANPKLRVIRITDGSLLDEESMAAIAKMAKDKDFQVWVEMVDSTGKVGIVIEDGEVVAVNEEAPAEAAAA